MAHVFGNLLRQNFRCGRMPNSRANAVRARGNAFALPVKPAPHCIFCPGVVPKRPPAFLYKTEIKQK